MTWFERWLQRQNDIAQGADADLLAENGRRWWWAVVFFLAGPLLVWIGNKWPLPHAAHTALNVVAALLAALSLILFSWARAMNRFLKNPDREGSPSILKEE